MSNSVFKRACALGDFSVYLSSRILPLMRRLRVVHSFHLLRADMASSECVLVSTPFPQFRSVVSIEISLTKTTLFNWHFKLSFLAYGVAIFYFFLILLQCELIYFSGMSIIGSDNVKANQVLCFWICQLWHIFSFAAPSLPPNASRYRGCSSNISSSSVFKMYGSTLAPPGFIQWRQLTPN